MGSAGSDALRGSVSEDVYGALDRGVRRAPVESVGRVWEVWVGVDTAVHLPYTGRAEAVVGAKTLRLSWW